MNLLRSCRWAPLTAMFLCLAPAAKACETPVYRYAMYRWTPLPYEAYYFHRGQVSKADQEVHRLLAEGDKDGVAANVLVTPVDLDRKDALEALPQPVKKLWQAAQGGKPLPSYLVFTPWGDELFAGSIDPTAARDLTQSPLRSDVGKLFGQCHGVVLLILEGDKPEENARMEDVARKVMDVAAAGRLFAEFGEDPNTPPTQDSPASAPALADAQPGAKTEGPAGAADVSPGGIDPGGPRGGLRVGLVKLQRSNTAEAWLLKILLAMAPDPESLKPPHEPMLYAIYGRGRVMPPGVGKEVTVESLSNLLRFLGDRCSCTIKDQNPGLDLLMRWDWEATAEKFAAEEEGTAQRPLYAEMPADGPLSTPPDAKDQEAPAATPASPAPSSPAVSGTPPSPVTGTQVASAATTPVAAAAAGQAPTRGVPEHDRSAEGFAARQRWQLGLGLAGVAALVLGIGFMLIRRQQHASS